MNKDEIFLTLKKNIMQQLEGEVEESEVGMNKSMAELGANSLDIIEIVSRTMREIKVKVPREELAKLKNLKELAEIMAKYKNEQDTKNSIS